MCDGPLPVGRRPQAKTCSDACRQARWRRYHHAPLTAPEIPTARPRKPVTVYECPGCGARLLGAQLCDGCHSFMRRLGYGGSSPCCGEPVTFDELLES